VKCPIRVINAGIPGITTRQAREQIDRDVIAHHPDIVSLSFGINDSAVDVFKQASEPRVPLEEYKQNLTWMVERLQSRKIRPILMTPNPVAWTDELIKLYGKPPYRPNEPNGWNVLLKNYAQVVRAVAKDQCVRLVDTYALFAEYASRPNHNLNDLMLDGMHPSNPGHEIIANHLMKLITKRTSLSKHSKD
jgi:lysophospholipase L1-like esterase